MHVQRSTPSPKRRWSTGLLAAALVGAVGCGGGGGGDAPRGPAEPRPTASPIALGPGSGSDPSGTARVVLENGDVAEDGFVIGNIEDAALAADGSIALIAQASEGNARAVLRRSAGGALTTILDERNAPSEIDVGTLSRIRMAPTGEFAFKSGDGLDSDQLHLARGEDVQTIAGLAGAMAPDFRILGNFRIVSGGLVAFVGGGGACEREASGDSVRDLCTVALFTADGREIRRIVRDDFELDRRQATDAQIALNQSGGLFFSIPGRRDSPVVVGVVGEEVAVLVRNNGELPGVGVVRRIDAVGLDEDGSLLVELGLSPEDPEAPVVDRLGVLRDLQFTEYATEGDVEGDRTITALRGLGIGGGYGLFEVTLTDRTTSESISCLRIAGDGETSDVACVGDTLPGETREIFSFGGARINSRGDVLFVTVLGTRGESTTRVEEIRALVRRADGEVVTIVSSGAGAIITQLTTAGFNVSGQALLIAERSRSSDRALYLGDSR